MKQKIIPMKSRLVNAAGRVKAVLFDKTGTLTDGRLNLLSVAVVEYGQNKLQVYRDFDTSDHLISDSYNLLLLNFMWNHSLVRFKNSHAVLGDPLETELAYHAERIGAEQDFTRFDLLHVFEFSSKTKTMTVVIKDKENGHVYVFSKGAPEVVIANCVTSGLGQSIISEISNKAKKGYRNVAFSYKRIDKLHTNELIQTSETNQQVSELWNRKIYESDHIFQGLASFENKLKPNTRKVIIHLRDSDISTAMITGDNFDTAISVARSTGIVPTAVEPVDRYYFNPLFCGFGKKPILPFEHDGSEPNRKSHQSSRQQTTTSQDANSTKQRIGAIDSEDLAKFVSHYKISVDKPIDIFQPDVAAIATKIKIFSRMTPEQKELIVYITKLYWKELNCMVAYCGDGANDTLALQQADIGVALCKDRDLLFAPFMAYTDDISCVDIIIREGRTALSTNYEAFRYFCIYSLLQTSGMLCLIWLKTEFSDWAILYMDLIQAVLITYAIGSLTPLPRDLKQIPPISLLRTEYILSIVLNTLYTAIALYLGIYFIREDSLYKNIDKLTKSQEFQSIDIISTYENSVII